MTEKPGKIEAAKTRRPRGSDARKHYSEMTAAELADATRDLEHLKFEDTRPLTRAGRARFERARNGRGRGRPSKLPTERVERVLISIAPGLLKRADEFAGSTNKSRSELVAEALELRLKAG
jgi:hypothetical protein